MIIITHNDVVDNMNLPTVLLKCNKLPEKRCGFILEMNIKHNGDFIILCTT